MSFNYFLILTLLSVVIFSTGLFGVKYYLANPQKKILIHSLVIGFLITIFSTINIIINPYTIEFQIFVTWVVFFLLLFSLFSFENNRLLVSFSYLIVTLMLLFSYIIPVTGGKGSLVAYFFYTCYFLIYHSYFTINKQFILRTQIILTSYIEKSNLLKLILWIILVFIPSLFTNGFVFFFVLQSIMINSFFSGRYWVFYIMLGLWSWIIFLYLMNKYNLNNKFLQSLLNYFSRRACLHYIGNSFGRLFVQNISKLEGKVIAYAIIAGGGAFAQALYPAWSDMVTDGERAAYDAGKNITDQELSKYPEEMKPLYIEYQKKSAFITEIKHRPHGTFCLENKLIWYTPSENIDKKQFAVFEQKMNAQNVGLSIPEKTLADICKTFDLEHHDRCREIPDLTDDQLRLRTKIASAKLFEHLKNTHFPQFSMENIDELSREEMEELYRIFSDRIRAVLKAQATESFQEQNFKESSLNSSHSSNSLETLPPFDDDGDSLDGVASFGEERTLEPETHERLPHSSKSGQSHEKPKSIEK